MRDIRIAAAQSGHRNNDKAHNPGRIRPGWLEREGPGARGDEPE